MELYQLKYFAKAARYENISMAAQELHVSQPSISKAIKALEGELQVELMRKEGKHSVHAVHTIQNAGFFSAEDFCNCIQRHADQPIGQAAGAFEILKIQED